MNCDYGCYQVGGGWREENPNCPTHGKAAIEHREESLRDYFAAAALTSLVGHTPTNEIASLAYALADAMLKQREKR